MYRLLPFALFSIVLLLSPGAADAQIIRGEAVAGEPYGVGRITMIGGPEPIANPATNLRLGVEAAGGRIRYPVYASGPVRQLLREFIQPASMTVYFLFEGNEPLDVTLYTPEPVRLRIRPERPTFRTARLLDQWWDAYTVAAEEHREDGEYPTIADAYLTSMLARRLDLPLPERAGGLLDMELGENVELLLGTEDNQARMIRNAMSPPREADRAAERTLPQENPLEPLEVPAAAEDVKIEPLAAHVPEECFYLRTGNYANYVWMQVTLEEFGGELRNMISERGINFRLNEKTEAQLGLKETALSRVLGGALISDVAVIGTDTFFREGPAMGILFEARNNLLLSNSLRQQRDDAKANYPDAVEETIEIGDKKVSFYHTPDNRLRSFYVIDGDYHLVTTSRYIAERFLEAGAGERPLSKAADFRYARGEMPLSRNDSIFLYVSDAFWRNLAGPQYRIEGLRRNQAIAAGQVLELARWAAWNDGVDTSKVSNLVEAGFLPEGFGKLADGSKTVVRTQDEGLVYSNSLRGARGYFTPVPDVAIEQVTARELASYEQFVEDYNTAEARLDPIVAGIRRYRTDQAKVEEVSIEAHVLPLSSRNWESLTRWLGPATRQRLARLSTDVVRLDVVSSGESDNYLFLGLEEFNAPLTIRGGRVSWSLLDLAGVRGYLGGAPDLGRAEALLNLLDLIPARQAAEPGFTQFLGGLTRFRSPEMTVLAFNRAVLDRVIPQFRWIEAERPAQIRLHVGDLSQGPIRSAGNALGYQRALDVSHGNAVFLHSLHRQLGVPLADARQVAELLLDAQLVCPLGGEYKLVEPEEGRRQWRSSAEARLASLRDVPEEYEAPVVQWLRGLDAEVEAQRDRLSIRARVLIERERIAPGGEARPGVPAEPELLKTEPEPLDELDSEVLPPPEAEGELPGKPLVPAEELPPPPPAP